MTGLLNRLGVVGVSLMVGAVIFGLITGGIVIHRLENPAALVTIGRHDDQKNPQVPAKSQDEQDQQGSQDEKQDSQSGTKGESGSTEDKKDSD